MGAIATGGTCLLNPDVILEAGLTPRDVEEAVRRERAELDRRERAYRDDRPPVDVHGRTVVLVDDGLATGATMRAAVAAVRRRGPARVVVGVPTAAPDTCDEIATAVDELVCPLRPDPFYAVGLWYEDFTQTTDDEVRACLAAAGRPGDAAPAVVSRA